MTFPSIPPFPPSSMTKSTPHNTGDIRCKGTKSDYDLVTEYMELDKRCSTGGYRDSRSLDRLIKNQIAIEEEIGKDRLEFLVFKIKTKERLEKLEANNDNDERENQSKCDFLCTSVNSITGEIMGVFIPKQDYKPWYKRLYSLLTEILCPGVSVSAGVGILVGLLFCLIISKFS